MIALVTFIHVISCLFLIAVVLLQQGKGADLAGAFGGGGTQTVFGARGTVTLLHKLTTFGFILFIFTSIFLGVAQQRGTESSVMKSAKPAASKTETPAKPEAQKPTAAAPAPAQGQTPAATPQQTAPAAAQSAPAQQTPAPPAPSQPKAK